MCMCVCVTICVSSIYIGAACTSNTQPEELNNHYIHMVSYIDIYWGPTACQVLCHDPEGYNDSP